MSSDKTFDCRECSAPFLFSAKEAQFYATRGLLPPKRCQSCRIQRRQEKETNGGVRTQSDYHEATCSNCGEISQVPFKPSAGRPVFCQTCFRNR